MFLLYYFEQDQDGGQLEIIKISHDKNKLESIKNKLIEKYLDTKHQWEQYYKKQRAFYKQKCNEVADWFEQNMDAILEYPRGQNWGKWDYSNHKTRDYPDWHTSKFQPYHPDVILRDKREFIKKIRNSPDYNPWLHYEKYVDYSKIKNKFYSKLPDNFEEQYPSSLQVSQTYSKETLYIEEVEEI